MTNHNEDQMHKTTKHYAEHPEHNLHGKTEYEFTEVREGPDKESGIWEKTKEVSGNIWEKTKEVSSDIWEGTKNLAGDAKNAITKDDDDYIEDDIEIDEVVDHYDKNARKHNRDYL